MFVELILESHPEIVELVRKTDAKEVFDEEIVQMLQVYLGFEQTSDGTAG